ncbi:MAG: DNA polymerase I, partial [Planctomycetes bacterium]|nr:DNA polymerase I [Planctomycetota bacterium]
IDAMSFIFRGYFAMWDNPRMTSDGINVSAVVTLASNIHRYIQQCKATHVAVAFDSKPPTFRHKMFAGYKADRGEMPNDLAQSLPLVFKLCAAMNVVQFRKAGYEADDIIATLVQRAEKRNYNCMIISPDKDLAQLVSAQTTLWRNGKKGSVEVLDEQAVCSQWAISHPQSLVDLQALMGDSVDCIPGVPGIGAKTGAKLLAQWGDLEGVLSNIDQCKGKQRENLENHADSARLSYELAAMCNEVPIKINLSQLRLKTYNKTAVSKLCKRMDCAYLSKRLIGT